jgi:hypothetical protein
MRFISCQARANDLRSQVLDALASTALSDLVTGGESNESGSRSGLGGARDPSRSGPVTRENSRLGPGTRDNSRISRAIPAAGEANEREGSRVGSKQSQSSMSRV